MNTKFLTLLPLVVVALLGFAPAASAQIPYMGWCCSPAEIQGQPLGAGCNDTCFVQGSAYEWGINCSRLGDTSFPSKTGGNCHLSESNLECALVTCEGELNLYTCRSKRVCGAGQVKCVWEVSGAALAEWTDCSGHECVGPGGPSHPVHVGC